jgi:high-affinity iron transporter
VAIAIGFGIYKGGVKINLAKFFTATGLVLVLVAAGLVAFAMHTGHEAGWIDFGQAELLDLSWLIKPGTVQSALLTGVLGIQPKPTVIEGVAWIAYFVPVTLFVVRSSRRKPAPAVRQQTPATV